MTFLVSALGFAGRAAGGLLTSALGWASTLLFGRVPSSHRALLSLMMGLSFAWLVAMVALALPSLASFLIATTPHPSGVEGWLGVGLAAAAVLLPPLVGLAGYLVPAASQREKGASIVPELLRGYLLAPVIAALLIFLAGVGLARKARSLRHGWSDVHVAVVIEPGDYDGLVDDLVAALATVDLKVTVRDAPGVLTLPAHVLTAVAGPNVRKLRPDRLVELRAQDLRIGAYPSDIAISARSGRRTRARAAILSRLTASAAHLTTSAEAQEIEDRLAALARGRVEAGHAGPRLRSRLADIDAALLDLEIPTEEWDVLYRERLQVERDLLVGRAPDAVASGAAANHDAA